MGGNYEGRKQKAISCDVYPVKLKANKTVNNFHSHTDAKGKDLSKLINNYNLTILNDGTPTMADFATAPDLTLATTEMSPHTTWNPINQSCGSEHLPILISLGVRIGRCSLPHLLDVPVALYLISLGVKYSATGTSNKSRWKLNKADWGLFKTLCEKNIVNGPISVTDLFR